MRPHVRTPREVGFFLRVICDLEKCAVARSASAIESNVELVFGHPQWGPGVCSTSLDVACTRCNHCPVS